MSPNFEWYQTDFCAVLSLLTNNRTNTNKTQTTEVRNRSRFCSFSNLSNFNNTLYLVEYYCIIMATTLLLCLTFYEIMCLFLNLCAFVA